MTTRAILWLHNPMAYRRELGWIKRNLLALGELDDAITDAICSRQAQILRRLLGAFQVVGNFGHRL